MPSDNYICLIKKFYKSMDEFYNDTNPNMQQAILNYKNYVADAIDHKDLYVAPKSLNVIEVNSFWNLASDVKINRKTWFHIFYWSLIKKVQKSTDSNLNFKLFLIKSHSIWFNYWKVFLLFRFDLPIWVFWYNMSRVSVMVISCWYVPIWSDTLFYFRKII